MGDTAVFSVKAENVASYQWQLSTNGGKTWNNSSTKDTMSFTLTAARMGYQVKCILTGLDGTTIETQVCKIIDPNITDSNGVIYEILEGTTLLVKSYSGNASSLVIVPTLEHNGTTYTVTEIGEEAFMDNISLTSIDLPDTIVIIHARAFKNCSNLREMK